jgi:hypothetical protein
MEKMCCWNKRKHGQFYNSTHRILQTDYEAAGIRYYTRDDGTAKPTAAAGPESLQRLKIPVATTTVIFTY